MTERAQTMDAIPRYSNSWKYDFLAISILYKYQMSFKMLIEVGGNKFESNVYTNYFPKYKEKKVGKT